MLFFLSCSAPEAPEEYEDLVSYLFSEMANDDEAYPRAGVENLQEWLSLDDGNLVEDGVQIERLPSTAVDGLVGENQSVVDLSGVSIVTESSYSPTIIADALTQYSFAEMMPDVYEVYDRTFTEGKDCIVDGSCLWAQAEAYTVADWGLLGTVEAQRIIQFRWIETNQGPVFLQRWWLIEPSLGSSLGLVIHNQYYIGATMPTEEGAIRMHASWLRMELSTGDASDGAANQLISNWKKDAESLDEWILEQEQ
jgi:hypothetical protein